MRWPGALVAEVARGFDDAAAEDHLPDAVDGDACGEWVFLIDDPIREVESSGGAVNLQRRKCGWCVGE